MSVFTSRITKVVPVPHAEGQSITIRKLNPKQLQAARDAQQDAAQSEFIRHVSITKALGDDLLKAVQEVKPETVKAATQADPLLLYDAATLAAKGIVDWSFDVKLGPEAIDDLDEETLNLVASEVLKLTKPDLFKTADEAEADRKND